MCLWNKCSVEFKVTEQLCAAFNAAKTRDTIILHLSERNHTHTHTLQCSGGSIHSIMSSILAHPHWRRNFPTLSRCFYPLFLLLSHFPPSFWLSALLSSPLLFSDPRFINLSSTAASARLNWWAEAISHTEVTVHTYTCIDAEGVILAGLHCTKSASHNVAAVACITPSWSN